MLKFTVLGERRTLVGLGLSGGNWSRLKKGNPILVHLDKLDVPAGKPIDVLILGAETEQAVVAQALKLGFEIVPGTTKVTYEAETH